MGGKNNQGNQGNQGGAGGNLGLYGGNQNQTQQNVGGMKNNGAGQQYSQQQAPQYQGRQAPGYMGGTSYGNDNPSSFQNLYNEYVSNPSRLAEESYAPPRFDPRDDTGFFQGGASGPSPFLLEGRQSPSRPVGRQAPGYMGGNPYGNDTPTRPIRPIPTRPEVGTEAPGVNYVDAAGNPYMMPPRPNSPWNPNRPWTNDGIRPPPRPPRPVNPNSPWNPTRPVFNPLGDIFPGYEAGGPNNPRPQPGKPMYPDRPDPRPFPPGYAPPRPFPPGYTTPIGTGGPFITPIPDNSGMPAGGWGSGDDLVGTIGPGYMSPNTSGGWGNGGPRPTRPEVGTGGPFITPTPDNFPIGTGGVNGPDMFAGGSPTFDESAPIGATQPWQPGGDSLTMEAYDNAANPNAPRKPIDFENLNTENRATFDAAVLKNQYRKAFQAAGYSESQIAALEAANNPSQTNPVLYE
tara:strand:+ start:5146 stop:6522 length:1377 start_codon:yes stop_codon:yes gene_type:complete